jgi:hypothetical protein
VPVPEGGAPVLGPGHRLVPGQLERHEVVAPGWAGTMPGGPGVAPV